MWARGVQTSLEWTKRKAITAKLEPPAQFLAEEKFTFQRNISCVVHEHDVPPELVFNLDQTPLSNVSPGKYTFDFQGAKNVPIKRVDDKRQINATFCVNSVGEFFPMQRIYETKVSFPPAFNVTLTENHCPNLEKSIEFFEKIIFPAVEKVKAENGYAKEQKCLIIMDTTFKGQDNSTLQSLCNKNDCQAVTGPRNLTNKFRPRDISVNKSAKSFMTRKYNV